MTRVFEEDNPLALVVHKLNVSRYATTSIDAATVDRICQDASAIFGQCRVQVIRNTPVVAFTTGSGIINSQSDFQAVCSAGLVGALEESATLGMTKKVHVVNQINWCGTIKPNVIGCANTPGVCVVVVRFSASLEGHLWAHEVGHTFGLSHRSDLGALMYPTIGVNNRGLNSAECSKLRQKFFFGKLKGSEMFATRGSIVDFVHQAFPHGVPYSEASQFTQDEGETIIPLLSEGAEQPYWANVVIVLGMIGSPDFSPTLIDFVQRNDNGNITVEDYNARTSALTSLGYIVNKSGDQRALDYLRAGTAVDFWRDLNLIWKAPYQSSLDERNAALASACVLGLAIAGERGVPILENIVSDWDKSEDVFLRSSLASAKSALNDARIISGVGLARYYGDQE